MDDEDLVYGKEMEGNSIDSVELIPEEDIVDDDANNYRAEKIYYSIVMNISNLTNVLISQIMETFNDNMPALIIESNFEKKMYDDYMRHLKRLFKEIVSFNKSVYGVYEKVPNSNSLSISFSNDNIKRGSKITCSLQGDYSNSRIEIYNNSRIIKHFSINENTIHFTPENEGELTIRVLKSNCKSDYIKISVSDKSENEELKLNIKEVLNIRKENVSLDEFDREQVISRSGQLCYFLKVVIDDLKAIKDLNPDFVEIIEVYIESLNCIIENIKNQIKDCRRIRILERRHMVESVLENPYLNSEYIENDISVLNSKDLLNIIPDYMRRMYFEFLSEIKNDEEYEKRKNEIKKEFFIFAIVNLNILIGELQKFIEEFDINLENYSISSKIFLKYNEVKKQLIEYMNVMEENSLNSKKDFSNIKNRKMDEDELQKLHILISSYLNTVKGIIFNTNKFPELEKNNSYINSNKALILRLIGRINSAFLTINNFDCDAKYKLLAIEFNKDLEVLKDTMYNVSGIGAYTSSKLYDGLLGETYEYIPTYDINSNYSEASDNELQKFMKKWGEEAYNLEAPTGGKYFFDNGLDAFTFATKYKKYYRSCGTLEKYDYEGELLEDYSGAISIQKNIDSVVFDDNRGNSKKKITLSYY